MRLGILFSGGKDSTLALHVAAENEEVTCLITVLSKNKESFMFHTPNIDITALQAEALGLPQITKTTQGEKERELRDLEDAIDEAAERFQIEGVVTGAIESVYQAERIQRICNRLGLWCFNPLWKHDQKALLEELLEKQFKVIISGVFAYPLDEKWLGKQIDNKLIERLVELQRQYGLSPSGEGGEIETTVLDAPLFKKKIDILDYSTEAKGNAGVFTIKQARLVSK
ncbi:MAG: diphthine--ammonia ligase [Candidatus Bathyarchaeia archaeon]|jgi:ABC transporter with metal-binding/Fe-S-binding domain ATP-binding protein